MASYCVLALGLVSSGPPAFSLPPWRKVRVTPRPGVLHANLTEDIKSQLYPQKSRQLYKGSRSTKYDTSLSADLPINPDFLSSYSRSSKISPILSRCTLSPYSPFSTAEFLSQVICCLGSYMSKLRVVSVLSVCYLNFLKYFYMTKLLLFLLNCKSEAILFPAYLSIRNPNAL